MRTWRLTKQWQHLTLEEALTQRLMEAIHLAERSGSHLPSSRIPGILADILEPANG